MQQPRNYFQNLKLVLLIFGLSFLSYQTTNAQLLKKLKKTINDATEVVTGIGWLANATHRTLSEFNQDVTIVEGNNGNKKNKNGASTDQTDIPTENTIEPKIRNGKFTNLDWHEVCYFDDQLFPSAIICMSTYTGERKDNVIKAISNPLGFRVICKKSNVVIRWEIESVDKRYFDKASGTYIYDREGTLEKSINPPIPWNYKALANHVSTEPLNIYFRLFDDKGNKVEKLVTVSLRSINDCLRYYQPNDKDDKHIRDLRFMYSTYIQEEDPAIDTILREGLDTKMVDAWLGYQGGEEGVDLQVATIWRVLHDRGFAYSDIATTTGDKGTVYSQVVRTFHKALKTNQANCVDGTVVFASILRKIGIQPIMVLVPSHCFLGYYIDDETDGEKRNIHFLETTMLSRNDSLKNAKTDKAKEIAYIKLFRDAKDAGMEEFRQNKKDNPNKIYLIDVDKWRSSIKPIPVYN